MRDVLKIIFLLIIFLFISCTESRKKNIIHEKNPLKSYLSSDTLRPWYLRGVLVDEKQLDSELFVLLKKKQYKEVGVTVELYQHTAMCGECYKYQLLRVISDESSIIIPLNDICNYLFFDNHHDYTRDELQKIIKGVKMPNSLNLMVQNFENKGLNFDVIKSFVDNLFISFIIVSRDIILEESELHKKIRTLDDIDSLDEKYPGFASEFNSILEKGGNIIRKESMYYLYHSSIYKVSLLETIDGKFNLSVKLLYVNSFEDRRF